MLFVCPFLLFDFYSSSAFDQTKTKQKSSLHLEDSVTCTAEFILEGKQPKEFRRGHGDCEEASSLTPLPLTDTSRPFPWQSESLLASSWSTMEDADIEDTHSLDSSGSGTQDTDENQMSSSDTEPLGQEEELGQRGKERTTSGLSEFSVETEDDIQAPHTVELLVLAEEPHTETEPEEFMQVVPPMALPPLPILHLEPPSNTSTPVLCTAAGDTEELFSTPQGLHPPSILTQMNPPIVKTEADDSESSQKHSVQASSPQKEHSKSNPAKEQTITEVPVLLCGGAALIAVVGVLAYGAVALLRK